MIKRLFISITLFYLACSSNVPEPVQETIELTPYGNTASFEIATWNIQYFPKNNKTLELVKEIVAGIDVDLIAVQEIASVAAFNRLLDSLPNWKGVLSADSYSDGSYQKTGLLYKSDFISVSAVENIFNDDSDAFPRPPLKAYIEIKDFNGTVYDFNIIVLHLKASGFGDEQDNIRRRRAACLKLESYISQSISNGADPDFIVLGDWNDELSDTTNNVFQPFLEKDSLYSFLTLSVNEASYPGYNSLIDHILISADSNEEYNSGDVSVLKLDQEISRYGDDVSDHRPVAARFRGFVLDIMN